MFQSATYTLPKLFLASKEEAGKAAHSVLQHVTCLVRAEKADDITTFGSGFIYSSTYTIMTCKHVVKDAIKVTVDGFEAKVAAESENVDLAVLTVKNYENQKHNLPYLQLAPQVDTGDAVFCSGFFNQAYHFSDGIVSRSDDLHTIVVTNHTDHGTSGGPAIGKGLRELIGVIREDYGISHHRTSLIPPWDIDYFLISLPELPQIEVYKRYQE